MLVANNSNWLATGTHCHACASRNNAYTKDSRRTLKRSETHGGTALLLQFHSFIQVFCIKVPLTTLLAQNHSMDWDNKNSIFRIKLKKSQKKHTLSAGTTGF